MSARRAAAKPWRRPALVIAALLVAGVAVWAGLQSSNNDDDDAQTSPGGSEAGIVHVHGLGVNPADGELYIATHSGLFRLPAGGGAVRVGDSHQDTMGFTVVGPDRFMGSGHPDQRDNQLRREGKPPLLGLIESTDAGKTWEARSLLGEADFHVLDSAHDRVYGWNASTGELMVSDDGRSWRTRSTLGLFSFAVDPADPDRLVGATRQGVAVSTDGGATWKPLSSPPVVLLAWDADSGLWGIQPDGVVHQSDDGSTWHRAGELPGEPQALHVTASELYAAAHDEDGRTAIYRSVDNGQTWKLRYRDPHQ